jgi:crotonobetainyl-CoA:carnitine CoA-transferase CaiB-like acyl-CoA transferase
MLDGIRILDLSRVLAGPLATMVLGDMGAHVIKVEKPGTGDDTRAWGPPFDAHGQSAYYLSINRNKLSIAADLRDPADRATVRALIGAADVVVENFLPGALNRLGIGASALMATHPKLVWCTISGFGADSPRPGYDLVTQAERGWMSITGQPDGPPTRVGIAITDVLAGKDAALAILGALVERARTGIGKRVHVSLSQSAAAGLINVAQNVLVSGKDATRWGNAHPNLAPYQLFDTADRPIIIAVGNDAQWRACALALDLSALADDQRFSTNAGRLAHRDELIGVLAARLHERPAALWLSALDGAGVPCGVVKSVLEVLRDVDASPRTGVAPSVPGSVRLPPPRLDEHGALIRRAGWGAFDVGASP